jgi:aspartyl-tRNA(Asn)/glutamyl-tRNA(Gln) amidotransferase subunit C
MYPMITKQEIQKLADLSRIAVSEVEMEALRKDIDNILGYVGEIQTVSAEPDFAFEPAGRNVFRSDENPIESGRDTEELLKLAPARQAGYLKVKKIL